MVLDNSTAHVRLAQALLLGIAILSLFVFFNYCYPSNHYTKFDDAYMSLRYARHWLTGNGFSWNVADGPAYGITSFSHLMIVTGLCSTSELSNHLIVTGLSYVAGLLGVASLVTIGFTMFPYLRKTRLPLLFVPAMLLSASFRYHSSTGMETTLAVLANSWLAAAALGFARRPNFTRTIVCVLAANFAWLTRPDMGLYCLLVPILLLLAEDRTEWKRGALYGILFAAVLLIDLVINKQLFGDFLPLPFFAKRAEFYRGYTSQESWNQGRLLFTFLHDSLPLLLVLACFATRDSLGKLAAIFIPMLLTFAYYCTVMQIMGNEARYYYPSLSFLVLGCFIACDSFLERWTQSQATERSVFWLPRFCMAILLLILFNAPMMEEVMASICRKALMKEPEKFTLREIQSARDPSELSEPSWWKAMQDFAGLVKQLPQGITLATSEHGYLGALFPEMPIIDLVGLHDRHIATHGFTPEYMVSRQPDIIWLPPKDYGYMQHQISYSDEFAEHYEYYPNIYLHGIAIRKDSPWADQIRDALAKDFARVYPGRSLSDYQAKRARATP